MIILVSVRCSKGHLQGAEASETGSAERPPEAWIESESLRLYRRVLRTREYRECSQCGEDISPAWGITCRVT